MNMESKFKVGDRVRVLDCPVMPDVVGKSGVIRVSVRSRTLDRHF